MLLFCLIMTLCKHKVGRVAKYRRFSHVNHFQLWVLKDNISIPTHLLTLAICVSPDLSRGESSKPELMLNFILKVCMLKML